MIYNITLIFKKGFTEGQHIFNLKFNNLNDLTNKKKLIKLILFYSIKYLFPYLINKIEIFIDNRINSSNTSEEDLNFKDKILNFFLSFTSRLVKIGKMLFYLFEFINFIIFLSKGEFPQLVNRLFGFDYVS